MNQNLQLGKLLQNSPLADGLEPLSVVLKVLNLPLEDEIFASRIGEALLVKNFRLGDKILPFDSTLTDSGQHPVHREQPKADSYTDLYFVCRGRVRLLCQSNDQQREVTAQLLEADETFGADSLVVHQSLPYRAIAASPVQIAHLPAETLVQLLQQFSDLQKRLQQQAELRQRLIFFRTQTSLRSLSSHQLKQLALTLTEEVIPAQSVLAETASSSMGRFWLRRGSLSSLQNTPHPLPTPGDSWGYPEPTPNDWMTQTELQVYKLAPEAWDGMIALVPTLMNDLASGDTPSSTSSPSAEERLGQAAIRWIKHAPQVATPSPPAPAAKPTPVVFPKPLKRRLLDFLDRYPWVEQQSSSDCGAACLAMIARYWGKQFPVYVLRERANVGRSGASLKNLASAAESLGFHTRPVRASLGRMAEQRNPWIAHWEGMHYVVVYRIAGKRVIIADPAMGRRSLSKQEFQANWTGYALLLDPTDRLQETEIQQASFGRYLAALLPYRSLVLQVILFSILIQIFGLVTPLFTQIILDKVVVQRSLPTLNVFALGLLLFSVWSICLTSVRQYLLSYFANRLDLTLVSGFISHTLSLPLKFFESRRVGDIITRVQENSKIQRFLIQQVILAWLTFITGFVYLGLMFYYNRQLTFLVLLLIPPIVLITLGSTPILQRISREVFKEAADQNSVLVEMLTGVATIKSTAVEREARWCWEDQFTSLVNTQFRAQKIGIGLQSINGLINVLGSTALLWYGATLVIQEQLTIGQFVAFNMMIGYVISPVIALADLWDEAQEVLISIERLNDVFETQPEESAQQSLLVLPQLRGEVQVENVTFRYGEDEDQNTLQNISFSVKPGQTVAIVGRSGSGKSTLIKLLEGLYHPNRGRIIIDGHDIRHVSPLSLRSQIGVVPQECFLFSGTILENIALYRAEHTLEQAIEAAKLAEAHAFIQSLPLGYSTKVGERGSSLSGGQRQRIAIARALLGDPQILILDEATSSLDTESERRFQRNLAQISRNRTVFVIAHRLSTVRNADTILVLDRGVLVEQGNHKELMAAQGLYYHLAQQQLEL